jgi:hypothetical protein
MSVSTTDIQQEQQQPPTTGTSLAVPEDEDCINNVYHRCDDVEENTPATTERRHQPSSSTPWYNQRFVITFGTHPQHAGQHYIPVRPPELQDIPAEIWMEFFEKVQDAARTTTVRASSTLSTLIGVATMLMYAGMVAAVVLYIKGITDLVFTPLMVLYCLSVYLGLWKFRIDFDQHHTPGIQAVCKQYSPEFEERTIYYVEFKNHKSGLQFCQKMIRQLNDDEIRAQLHLKDVVMTAHAQRRNDDNDAATAHYATLV